MQGKESSQKVLQAWPWRWYSRKGVRVLGILLSVGSQVGNPTGFHLVSIPEGGCLLIYSE